MIDDIARGLRTLEEIIGQPVTCSAAAGWRADQKVIEAKEAFHLRYNSDCRGAMPFRPLLESGNPGTAQIPVTLPTWDEVIGRDVKAEDFNGWLLNRILRDKGTPVYTIHAEVEGCAYQHNFVDLLKRAAQEGVTFCPYQRRCRSDKLFAEILPDVKAGWVANKLRVVADEIGTLPYRPLRVYCLLLPVTDQHASALATR